MIYNPNESMNTDLSLVVRLEDHVTVLHKLPGFPEAKNVPRNHRAESIVD